MEGAAHGGEVSTRRFDVPKSLDGRELNELLD
jgi:hypothetical protein